MLLLKATSGSIQFLPSATCCVVLPPFHSISSAISNSNSKWQSAESLASINHEHVKNICGLYGLEWQLQLYSYMHIGF